MSNIEIIRKTFELNRINLNYETLCKLDKYYQLLIEYNKNINLTAITDIIDVASKHFVDSVVCFDKLEPNSHLLDIGTGAGFPGIPLKIIRPDLNIVLVDSLQKRVKFLNSVIKELNLEGITAIHSRIQDLNSEYREKFDYTTSRAVSKLNILCEYSIPYLKINGNMIAYKSNSITDEIENSQNSLKVLHSKIDKIDTYKVISINNESYNRSIIYVKKLEKTDKKYPRSKNLIEKSPL